MRFGRNLIAGLGNSTITAAAGFLATPFYLHFLGIEAYGLIGVFLTLQALLSLLDLGLSPTVNREVARGLAQGDRDPARRLLRTLGTIVWPLSAVVGLTLLVVSPWLAGHWLRAESLPLELLTRAIALMGIAVACRLPAGLYLGAVNGAQRIVVSSTATSLHAVVSAGGSIALMAMVSPSIETFFTWQACTALGYTQALRVLAWRSIGGRQGAKANSAELMRVWRFSAGMGLIAVSSVVFTQVDKVLLSTMLGLEAFGRYALAGLVAGGLYVVVTPVFNAIYPRFSALVAAGESDRLAELYSLGTRLLATLVFPLAMVAGVFAEPLLFLWTRDPALAVEAGPVVTLLLAGSALHAVMHFPYALQLAHGLPRLAVTINVVMIALLIPLMILLTLAFAEVGAALAWLVLHVFYLLFGTWMTHRRLLVGQGMRWLARDVGIPLLLVLGVAAVAHQVGAASASSGPERLLWAAGMLVLPTLVSLALSPGLRRAVLANRDTAGKTAVWRVR